MLSPNMCLKHDNADFPSVTNSNYPVHVNKTAINNDV